MVACLKVKVRHPESEFFTFMKLPITVEDKQQTFPSEMKLAELG
jgi:hypothetical protein